MNRRHVLKMIVAGVLASVVSACGRPADANQPWIPYPEHMGTPNMMPDQAYALYLAWTQWVGVLRKPSTAGIEMMDDGSFRAIYGALDFDYQFTSKKLRVMKVLLPAKTTMTTYDMPGPKSDQALAQDEPYTLGGGQFFINPHPWLSENMRARNPDVNAYTLMREFTAGDTPADRFVLDARWLVYWAEYWYPGGIGKPVSGRQMTGAARAWLTPEAQLATRPDLEAWAQSILSQQAPPMKSAYP